MLYKVRLTGTWSRTNTTPQELSDARSWFYRMRDLGLVEGPGFRATQRRDPEWKRGAPVSRYGTFDITVVVPSHYGAGKRGLAAAGRHQLKALVHGAFCRAPKLKVETAEWVTTSYRHRIAVEERIEGQWEVANV